MRRRSRRRGGVGGGGRGRGVGGGGGVEGGGGGGVGGGGVGGGGGVEGGGGGGVEGEEDIMAIKAHKLSQYSSSHRVHIYLTDVIGHSGLCKHNQQNTHQTDGGNLERNR